MLDQLRGIFIKGNVIYTCKILIKQKSLMLQNNINCSLLCSPQETRCCTRQPEWNSGSESWGKGRDCLGPSVQACMRGDSSGDLLHSGQPTALCCTAKDSKHGRVRGQLARVGCLLSCGFWCRALTCWAISPAQKQHSYTFCSVWVRDRGEWLLTCGSEMGWWNWSQFIGVHLLATCIVYWRVGSAT